MSRDEDLQRSSPREEAVFICRCDDDRIHDLVFERPQQNGKEMHVHADRPGVIVDLTRSDVVVIYVEDTYHIAILPQALTCSN